MLLWESFRIPDKNFKAIVKFHYQQNQMNFYHLRNANLEGVTSNYFCQQLNII
jgi:hypothetical protein